MYIFHIYLYIHKTIHMRILQELDCSWPQEKTAFMPSGLSCTAATHQPVSASCCCSTGYIQCVSYLKKILYLSMCLSICLNISTVCIYVSAYLCIFVFICMYLLIHSLVHIHRFIHLSIYVSSAEPWTQTRRKNTRAKQTCKSWNCGMCLLANMVPHMLTRGWGLFKVSLGLV